MDNVESSSSAYFFRLLILQKTFSGINLRGGFLFLLFASFCLIFLGAKRNLRIELQVFEQEDFQVHTFFGVFWDLRSFLIFQIEALEKLPLFTTFRHNPWIHLSGLCLCAAATLGFRVHWIGCGW